MKRNYIQPQVETLALNVESAVLTASPLGVNNKKPIVDDDHNLFSAGNDSWSSESWNDSEE